jgi:Putative polyhydroxyalkanoic acid system protein (PHA_gran_rgn)
MASPQPNAVHTMNPLLIERSHQLGLERALAVAQAWVAEGEQRWGVRCTRHPEPGGGERIGFKHSGASGHLLVTADRFVLEARLGFLLNAYRARIEAAMNAELDRLLQPPA